MEQIKAALEEAIKKADGIESFAKAIGAPSANAVKAWKRTNSIPADYCPTIERTTGVACERLRPVMDWAYLRGTAKAAAPTEQGAGHA